MGQRQYAEIAVRGRRIAIRRGGILAGIGVAQHKLRLTGHSSHTGMREKRMQKESIAKRHDHHGTQRT